MSELFSLYRELDEPIICFHNKNYLTTTRLPHLHSQYEFYYNVSGASRVFVDEKIYECTGHDLFFFPRLSIHKGIIPRDDNYERYVINIDPKVVDSINRTIGLHNPLDWMTDEDLCVSKKVNLNDEEHQMFVKMVAEYNIAKSDLSRYSIFIKILDFLSTFFADGKKCEEALAEGTNLLEKALMIVEERFKDIRVADISQMLYVNSSHLSTIFKEEYGITLEKYLIVRKIAQAKKYLYMGIPVKQVCELCGFQDYTNFIRTFKKYEGYSPKSLKALDAPLQ